MFIQQLYTNCLSEAAYFIESNGEAAVIDPLRDIDEYIKLAEEKKAVIKYIFETHFHADFVSGHLELAKATGAPIIYGPGTITRFPVTVAKDNEVFKLGNVTFQVIHTPGHTVESTCYLLKDEKQADYAIFTGDTLFIGDVGRPDLSSGDLNTEELAGMMYDSLQHKIMPLADHIIVYPAHGPGSSCGKNLGPETQSTIGIQKSTNYALQPQSREDFIKSVTEGLEEAPKYFSVNAKINQEGYPELAAIVQQGMTAMDVDTFKKASAADKVIVLDTRPVGQFSNGFIPGSIFIGLEGRFAEWAGGLLPFDHTLLLVTEVGQEKETIIRLARVGFSKIGGHLQGGFESWVKAGEKMDIIIDVEPDELAMDIPYDDKLVIVDVRKEAEYGDGHIKNAINLPLGEFTDIASLAAIEDNMNAYVHCAGGYRSVIAISLLKRQGIHNVYNVLGGYAAIKNQTNIETEKEESVLN
jgi:hydroxyacylglutathione hydrolase